MSEQHPDRVEDDDELGDPASSHGSDLDARIGGGQERPDQPLGADDPGP